jgi:hypothetical protein
MKIASFDLRDVPDDVLLSEMQRRRNAKRKTKAAGPGRPKNKLGKLQSELARLQALRFPPGEDMDCFANMKAIAELQRRIEDAKPTKTVVYNITPEKPRKTGPMVEMKIIHGTRPK